MTTPQEIREKSFDKARSMFGGYDMATIDEYLDELANDFEAMQKENLVLKSIAAVLKVKHDRTCTTITSCGYDVSIGGIYSHAACFIKGFASKIFYR